MIWMIVLVFVSLAASFFLFVLGGFVITMFGIGNAELRLVLIGLGLLGIGLVSLLCTGRLLTPETKVTDRTMRAGYRTSIAVGCFGAMVSLVETSLVPFVVFLSLALLSAAPFFVAWRCRLPEGACVVCRYDLGGLPSGVCPECGNDSEA